MIIKLGSTDQANAQLCSRYYAICRYD